MSFSIYLNNKLKWPCLSIKYNWNKNIFSTLNWILNNRIVLLTTEFVSKTKGMALININKVLPPNLAIDSIENILYSIGLSHQSIREGIKRSLFFSPKFIAIIILSFTINQTLSLLTVDEFSHLLLNELSLGMGIAYYISIDLIIISLMTLFMQSVYYWNHKRGLEPTFVRVFQVMSGSITPSSVGLTNERQVRQLLSIAKWVKRIAKNNKVLIPIFVLSYIIINNFYIVDKMMSYILFPYHFVYTCVWIYHTQNMLTIQLLLFFIICKYFKIKFQEKNERVKKIQSINPKRIKNILYSYDRLYREIDEYNTTFWSKFLFSIWFFFGVFIVVLIYLSFFVNVSIVITILSVYYTILYSSLYFFIMTNASSLNSEANKSYKIFNSFYVNFVKTISGRKVINFLKVNLF